MTPLPTHWQERELGTLLRLRNGANADKLAYGRGSPFINVREVVEHPRLTEKDIPGLVFLPAEAARRYSVRRGDILFNRTSETAAEVGLASIYTGVRDVLFGGFVIRGRPISTDLEPIFAPYAFRAPKVRAQIVARGQGGIRSNIGQRDLLQVLVPLPPRSEQLAIGTALSDADTAVAKVEALIAKKRALRAGIVQQLLLGKGRLRRFEPEKGSTGAITPAGRFPADWELTTIGEVARKTGKKNVQGRDLPVLSCTKHRGFVDSLSLFSKRVFSEDTSGYRLIRLGEFGYPANHIEEGSIGYQQSYGEALVSPIYVVFEARPQVNPLYLYTLLKTDRYRQLFRSSTSASVDRRGSLRWLEFSQIPVALPPRPEQDGIAEVIRAVDEEIELLEARLEKVRSIREGMTQALLCGSSDLPAEAVVA
jgi:type I restriction enzyme, S subunit